MSELGEVLERLRMLERRPDDVRLATPSEIEAAERALGIAIPADYRRFLTEASTDRVGIEEPGLVGPDRPPHRDLVRLAHVAWDRWEVARDLFPFATSDGDYYCLAADGQVVFWSHEGRSDEAWPDLATWIGQVWIEGR